MATGTIVLTGAATLTAKGYVTGAPADNKNERGLDYLAGQPPYSLRLGDTNIPLRFFGIPGRIMAMGADLHKVAQTYIGDSMQGAIGRAVHDIGNNILEESGFRGIAELYRAVEDYERYGKTMVQDSHFESININELA